MSIVPTGMSRRVSAAASWAAALSVLLGACGFFDGDDGGDGDPMTGDGGVGSECTSDLACRAGLVCADAGADAATGRCRASGTALEDAPCKMTANCAEGLYCGPRRTCQPAGDGDEGASCQSTADCQKGLVCVLEGLTARCQAAGDRDIGAACEQKRDCLAGLTCQPRPEQEGRACTVPPEADGDVRPPTPAVWRGVECASESGSARALFDVPSDDGAGGFYRLPFPNDIRRTSDGLDLSGHPTPGNTLPVDLLDRYLRAAEQDLNGFSTNPVVFFRFSEPHDANSASGNFKIVNVDVDSPDFGNTHGSVAWLNTSGPLSNYICPNWLAIRPADGAPLRPDTTYAVVLTTDIVPDDGDTYVRSSDFMAMLQSDAPSDAALEAAWQDYEPLRAWLADEGTMLASQDVLNAAVFTTQSARSQVPALRQAIREDGAPTVSELTVCDGETTSPCAGDGELRSCSSPSDTFVEIHGRIRLPIFQQGTPPYETPDDGGGIDQGDGSPPVIARHEEVCFAFTLPKGEPMPDSGWPLMIHAHGTGGAFTSAVRNGLAEDMAQAEVGGTPVPAATLGFDLPQHGPRRGESDRPPAELFFNFANPRAARDNVMQGAADLMSVVSWAEQAMVGAGDSPTGDAITFDPARVTLFAHSQGATHASLMLPYEPGVRAAVLSGNGGKLSLSLLHKTKPRDIASLVPFALADATREGKLAGTAFNPALAILQMYFDRVDALNYAPLLHRRPVEGEPGHHVFMTYGLGDGFTPPPTMKAYANAARLTLVEPVRTGDDLGLPTAAPPLQGNRMIMGMPHTVGMRQYEPAEGEDGHFVATQTDGGRRDTTAFLQEAMAGDTPAIGNP